MMHNPVNGNPMGNEGQMWQTGPNGMLLDENGEAVMPPEGWDFLPAGDAGLTRKVIATGMFRRVQTQRGRRTICTGLWAPAAAITLARQEIAALRATECYQNRLAGDRRRRVEKQREYEREFFLAVRGFLAFSPRYETLEVMLAEAVTSHAIPVGSGSVARTVMIPLAERAAKAVIAWMRHQTTTYDSTKIARIKGERREVRRMLARQSIELLRTYREGLDPVPGCPLQQALVSST